MPVLPTYTKRGIDAPPFPDIPADSHHLLFGGDKGTHLQNADEVKLHQTSKMNKVALRAAMRATQRNPPRP
ncbi:MAG: hypothetical protein U0640_06150 [Phycisphaerales bacterium]